VSATRQWKRELPYTEIHYGYHDR